MDAPIDKLEEIYKQLEAARKEAVEELARLEADAQVVDPRYRHKVREVKGQLIKLSIEASLGMAKVLEPITKDQSNQNIGIGKKELLEMLDSLDKKTEPVAEEKKPVQEEFVEEVADKEKLLEEIQEFIDAAEAK